MQRLLFLNARRRVLLAVKMKEYMKLLSSDLLLCSSDTDYLDPIRFFVNDFYCLHQIDDSEFSNELISLVKTQFIKGMFLWNDSDLLHICKIRNTLEELGVNLILPDEESILLCYDKRKTYEFAIRNKILIPNHYSPDSTVVYPVIIKPTNGAGSVNVYKAYDVDELKVFLRRCEEPIIQEYISGEEYTVDVFNDYDGNALCIVPRKRIKVRESEAMISQIDLDEELIAITSTINNLLKQPGPFNFQFIKKDKNFYLIEINSRISSTIDSVIEAGVPIHEWLVDMMLGKELKNDFSIKDKMYFSKYYNGVAF